MTVKHEIPTIDISSYLKQDATVKDRGEVIDAVRLACADYGFIQIRGHGVPVETQRKMLHCCKTLFDLPTEDKDELSLKNNPARRQVQRRESFICTLQSEALVEATKD